MRGYIQSLILGMLPLLATASVAKAQSPAPGVLVSTVPLAGDGRWDYAIVGLQPHPLYITRQTHMQVYDVDENKVVADLPGMGGIHGVALAPELDEAFLSDGQAGNVAVFDLKTNKSLGAIKAGDKPDAAEISPRKFERVKTAKTRPSAQTIALDTMTHMIYLDAADMEPVAGGSRPAPKHGSFVLVVVKPVPSR